jgi:endonuclease/exonuclease/phosphatase family metal-dependent hydrolase
MQGTTMKSVKFFIVSLNLQTQFTEDRSMEKSKLVEKRSKEDLETILRAELALLKAIELLQAEVKSAAEKREWADFEALNLQIQEVSVKFAGLEEARSLAIETQKEAGNRAGRAENTKKDPLVRTLMREMKKDISRVRWTGAAILHYIESRQALTNSFLEAIYPEKRGTIYEKSGKRTGVDMRSLVLDTIL